MASTEGLAELSKQTNQMTLAYIPTPLWLSYSKVLVPHVRDVVSNTAGFRVRHSEGGKETCTPIHQEFGRKKKDLINGKLGLIELGMLASAEMH